MNVNMAPWIAKKLIKRFTPLEATLGDHSQRMIRSKHGTGNRIELAIPTYCSAKGG
jgi:hypothetical protein